MSIYGYTSEAEAEALAARLTEARNGEAALGGWNEPADPGRIVTRYVVRVFDVQTDLTGLMQRYGIVERWTYADRPDLGELGGAFVARATIERLLGENHAP